MFVISTGGVILWPACYPNLSVCDLFLWWYLKSKLYLMKPSDIAELKNAIEKEVTATPDNMVREAMRTLCDRLEQCRQDSGKHLIDVSFKK